MSSHYSSFSPPDSGRIRCVCDYDDDDGFTIQCEQCLVWQHAKCVGISKNSVPEQYFCEECNPGWHEDLHNLALRAINLDVINASSALPQALTQANVNIFEDSGSTPVQPRTGFKRKISMPVGVPALNEISENIISNDAQPVIESFLRGLNVPRLKRQQHAQDPNLVNFEFQATVVMDSSEHLALLQRNLEVREIRNRGYQKKGTSTKYGLFATEPCDPGHFVCEFIGHVQLKNLLNVKGAKEYPVPVTQSFVLYPLSSIDLAVDARKFGTGTRYARRSCRPNVHIKPIIIESASKELSLSWGLFARNVIKANSEILLPLDYQCGNGLFKYECACNAPDFCLGPLDYFSVPSKETFNPITNSTSLRPASPKPANLSSSVFVESAELEALGIRRSSSAVLQDSQAAPSTTTRPILDSRKLSREERKLQKYIEYFEKMDHADAAKKVTSSNSTSSLGSRKGSSSGSSPQPSSRISSPDKMATAGGLKKAWKHLFSSSGESQGTETVQSEEAVTAVTKPTGAKRGRKPSAAKAQQAEQSSSDQPAQAISSPIATAPPSSPLKPKPKSPPKRKKSAQIAIVDEDSAEEIDVGSEIVSNKQPAGENESKKAKLSKKNKEHGTVTEIPPQTSSPLIDIERSSSVVSAELLQQGTAAVPEPVTTAPDTPSKKKLSLSDYLKKKKASPVGPVPLNFNEEHEEEGEIPNEPPVKQTTETTTESFGGFLSESVVSRRNLEEGEVENFEDRRRIEFETLSSSRDFLRQSIEEIPSGMKSVTSTASSGSNAEYKSASEYRDSRAFDYRSAEYIDRDQRDSIDGTREYRDLRESVDSTREYRDFRESVDSSREHRDWERKPQSGSRYRDEREKEFDRLQREREFERREAERERERREREQQRFRNDRGGERDSPPHYPRLEERRYNSDYRPPYRPYNARPYNSYNPHNPHGPHSSHNPHNPHSSHGHPHRPPFNRDDPDRPQYQGYPRPPNYRPNHNNYKKY